MRVPSRTKLTFLGGGLFTLGLALIAGFPTILDFGVRQLQQIREGSDLFEKWIEFPIPLTMKFFIFEVTNPKDVLRGRKPILKERGPYTFWEYRKKDIIGYSKDKKTVKYWETKTYYFDQSRSVGSADDKILIINAPMVAIGNFVYKLAQERKLLGVLLYGVINVLFALYRTNLFIETTPQQLVFDGYKVTELDTLMTLAAPIESLGILEVPRALPNNTFGLLYNRNGTQEAFYEVYTGQGGTTDKLTYFTSYRDKRRLKYWNSDYCNMINGTDGAFFHPFVQKEDKLYVFAFDLCRSIHLTYYGESEVRGIPTWRFAPPDQLFRGPHKNPDNMCFCPTPETPEQCYIDGVLDISVCWAGAPIFLSNPHFMSASPIITDAVEGLNPSVERHGSYIDIEPRVGVVLQAYRRLQVNVRVDQISSVSRMSDIQPLTIWPILWLEESAIIDDAVEMELNLKLVYPTRLGSASFVGMVVLGAFLCLFSFFSVFCRIFTPSVSTDTKLFSVPEGPKPQKTATRQVSKKKSPSLFEANIRQLRAIKTERKLSHIKNTAEDETLCCLRSTKYLHKTPNSKSKKHSVNGLRLEAVVDP